jgi:rRNA processing protein Gar1
MSRRGFERRYLGVVRSITPMGLVVVSMSGKRPVPLGSKVYFRDDSGVYREMGVVVDIIGNVERPHAVVKVSDKSILSGIPVGLEVSYEPRAPRGHRGAARRS